MNAKRERITRLYLPDCPWGPRCQEERRTLSVSSLRSTCRASEGSVRPSWMRPGASWKSHGWANLPMGTRGEVLIKHPRGYAHLTNLSPLLHHSLALSLSLSLFLSFRRFHFFLIFLLGFLIFRNGKPLRGFWLISQLRENLSSWMTRRKIVIRPTTRIDLGVHYGNVNLVITIPSNEAFN